MVLPHGRPSLCEGGAGALVWGSDWPHPSEKDNAKPDDSILFDLLAEWAPIETVRNPSWSRIRRSSTASRSQS